MNERYTKVFLILVLVSILITSCSIRVLEPVTQNGSTNIKTLTFNKYLEKGFEFSTYAPFGNFSVVGIVEAVLEPRIIPLPLTENSRILKVGTGEDLQVFEVKVITVNSKYKKYGVQQNINTEVLLDKIYSEGLVLGATGVSDLTIFYETKNTNGLDFDVLKASGVYIKK